MRVNPKHLANRRNAQRSTEPKTNAGKARSSRNATKHGLAAGALAPWADQKAKELAAQLAAAGVPIDPLDLAHASLALLRVRTARSDLLRSFSRSIDPNVMRMLLSQLTRLSRYEWQ